MIEPKHYSEIYELVNALGEKWKEKLPEQFRQLIVQNKDNDYRPKISSNKSVHRQGLSEETLAIFTILKLEFWCKDKNEQQEILKILNTNIDN